MSLVIDNKEPLSKAMLELLHDSEFSDVEIEAIDGGTIPANKAVLSVRSEHFRAVFSRQSNFVESRDATVELPFTEAVLEKEAE